MNLLKSSTFNKWDIVEGSTLSVDYYEQSDISTLAVQVYALYAASNENDDEFAKIGHQLKDLLISCKWRGLMCSPRYVFVITVRYLRLINITMHIFN